MLELPPFFCQMEGLESVPRGIPGHGDQASLLKLLERTMHRLCADAEITAQFSNRDAIAPCNDEQNPMVSSAETHFLQNVVRFTRHAAMSKEHEFQRPIRVIEPHHINTVDTRRWRCKLTHSAATGAKPKSRAEC